MKTGDLVRFKNWRGGLIGRIYGGARAETIPSVVIKWCIGDNIKIGNVTCSIERTKALEVIK